jgi:hypothetical protein
MVIGRTALPMHSIGTDFKVSVIIAGYVLSFAYQPEFLANAAV